MKLAIARIGKPDLPVPQATAPRIMPVVAPANTFVAMPTAIPAIATPIVPMVQQSPAPFVGPGFEDAYVKLARELQAALHVPVEIAREGLGGSLRLALAPKMSCGD